MFGEKKSLGGGLKKKTHSGKDGKRGIWKKKKKNYIKDSSALVWLKLGK